MEACPPRGTAKSPENSTPILQKKSPLSQMLGPVPICPNLPTHSASAGCGAQVYQGKEEREIHDYTENIFSVKSNCFGLDEKFSPYTRI